MFEWGDVRIFLAVAGEGSTIAAARKLGMNQSTVSRRIRALEEASGLRLFDRSQTGYSLTTQGVALVDVAGQMGAAATNVQLRIDRLVRDESGVIRVTAPALVMNGWGFRTIADFQAQYPEVEFDVDTSEAQVSLERGEADIALRSADEIVGDDLIARKVGDVIWAVFASRDYLLRHGMPRTAADLHDHRFYFYTPELVERIRCIALFGEMIAADRVLQRVNTVSGMIGAVQSGQALGLVPHIAAGVMGDLVCCLERPEFRHALWVVTSKDSHAQPLVRKFYRFAAENLRTALTDTAG